MPLYNEIILYINVNGENFMFQKLHSNSFNFLLFLLFVYFVFAVVYSSSLGPVGEYGSYVSVEGWGSVYGPFFRPLTLNIIPKFMNKLIGKNFSQYSFLFALFFVVGIAVASLFLLASLRWVSTEQFRLSHLAMLICFGFSNVYLISSLMVQYTVTDFVFMTAYAVFLLSVVVILNSGQIGIGSSILAGGGLALMCASKEFTLVVPVVLAMLVGLRFREAVALGAKQPRRTIALLFLLGMIAAIYLCLLLSKPTFVAATLAGAPPPGDDFLRAGFAKFLSNLKACIVWLSQAPVEVNYPYVFNHLPLLGPVSYQLSWAYVSILAVGLAAALLSARYRRVAFFQFGCILYWCLVASSNNRVLSSYLAPAFLHLALLWALGALVVLQRINSVAARGIVNSCCIGMLCLSLWLGSAVLYSPNRDVSFHGAMAAVDTQYRSILRVIHMSHERFVVTFETRNAPDYVPFHLVLSGALTARTVIMLDGFIADDEAQTVTVTGRRLGAPVAGEVAYIRVRADADPALGTRFRIMTTSIPPA